MVTMTPFEDYRRSDIFSIRSISLEKMRHCWIIHWINLYKITFEWPFPLVPCFYPWSDLFFLRHLFLSMTHLFSLQHLFLCMSVSEPSAPSGSVNEWPILLHHLFLPMSDLFFLPHHLLSMNDHFFLHLSFMSYPFQLHQQSLSMSDLFLWTNCSSLWVSLHHLSFLFMSDLFLLLHLFLSLSWKIYLNECPFNSFYIHFLSFLTSAPSTCISLLSDTFFWKSCSSLWVTFQHPLLLSLSDPFLLHHMFLWEAV